nr:MAG TPA: hypothetical protein [Caudoviricetes sp.]
MTLSFLPARCHDFFLLTYLRKMIPMPTLRAWVSFFSLHI